MLEIENLKTNFNTYDGVVKALDGVNLKIEDGEIFGLVGETGSGKTIGIALNGVLIGHEDLLVDEVDPTKGFTDSFDKKAYMNYVLDRFKDSGFEPQTFAKDRAYYQDLYIFVSDYKLSLIHI